MKRILTIVAAVAAAGLASASEVTWQSVTPGSGVVTSSEGGNYGSYNFSSALGGASTWAIRCTVTIGTLNGTISSYPVMFGFGGGTNDPRFYVSSDKELIYTRPDGTAFGSSANNIGTGVTLESNGTYTFLVSKTADSTYNLYVYSGSGDPVGDPVLNLTVGSTVGWSDTTLFWGSQSSSGGQLLVGNAVDGWTVSNLQYLTQSYEAWLLPEPTALALLALGVAGVALRRRVA